MVGWILLVLTVLGFLWWALGPRKFQSLTNERAIITKDFKAINPVDTAEDKTDLDDLAGEAAAESSDRMIPERKGSGKPH